jgi:uncharacterized protein
MAEQTSQEPTMEEILASIRRIISEDETPEADAKVTPPAAVEAAPEPEPEAAPAAAEAAPEPEPAPAAAPAPEPEPVAASAAEDDDDALELTEKVETVGDLDVYTPEPTPAPAPAPQPAPAPAPAAPAAALVSDTAATAAANAFGKLSQVIAMPAEGRTLEDVVRELLRPLLQQWLDDHLPGIVQESVQAEVERIARGRVR